ncbi:MAG: GNAT family N-acetyltransferase [Thermoplasmata archaeon]|nr:GNAT family N-acetyltransferase [Thermoplasmata archaeon]
MIELQPVAAEDWPEFRAGALRMYVDQLSRAGLGTVEELQGMAEGDIGHLLPDGPATVDNQLYWLRAGSERVGVLWFAVRRERPPPRGFVYALEIFPSFQRRGYGAEAMREVDRLAAQLGVENIGLSVFSYNAPAIRLYEKLGYSATAQQMNKRIPPTTK